MDLARHCELCDNRAYDVQTGTICSLTNHRPKFDKKCPDIKFGDNHINQIKEVNINYHKVASTKKLSIANFIVFLTIAVLIVLVGYLLGAYILESGFISTVPLIIMGTGVLIIPLATGPLVKYLQAIKVERNKKSRLDELLASYNIEYDVEILVDEDVHGNKEYEAEITFSRFHYR